MKSPIKSIIRNTFPRLFSCAVLFTVAGVVGCSDGEPAASPGSAPTEREVRALRTPEAGASATEYQSRLVTLRLFGTQGASDAGAATATFADIANFATQSYRVGETLGRNLQVAAIFDDRVEIVDTVGGARRTVLAGQDVSARLIEHDFDRAARDDGQHQWTVKGRVMARLAARYGLGAATTEMAEPFAGYRGRRLGAVDRRGVFGRLGLQEGDLLLAIDGQPTTESALSTLPARFAESKSQVLLLTVARGGNLWEAAYIVE